MADREVIKRALRADLYEDLFQLATAREPVVVHQKPAPQKEAPTQSNDAAQGLSMLSPEAKPLAHDITSVLDLPYK